MIDRSPPLIPLAPSRAVRLGIGLVYGVAAAVMWPGLSLLLAGVTSAAWRVLWLGSWLVIIATAILAVARFRAWIVAAAVSAVLMARFLWPVGVTYRELSLAGRLVLGLPLPRNVLIEVGFFEVAAMTLAQVVVFIVGVVTVARLYLACVAATPARWRRFGHLT